MQISINSTPKARNIQKSRGMEHISSILPRTEAFKYIEFYSRAIEFHDKYSCAQTQDEFNNVTIKAFLEVFNSYTDNDFYTKVLSAIIDEIASKITA